jgi:sulfoxide reductase heme-binding subunit YedZ
MATRIKKHYLPFLLLTLAITILFFLTWKNRDAITFTADATGYLSLALLALSLVIGPVNLLLKKSNPLSTYFRRDLGIYAGILALLHCITGLFVHLRGQMWQYFFYKTDQGYTLRFDDFGWANETGLFAGLLVILLLATSNDYSIKKLKPLKWKNIQRLSYLMFALVLIHCLYYRIVGNNLDRVYSLYLPILGLILCFQLTGIFLRLRGKQSAI